MVEEYEPYDEEEYDDDEYYEEPPPPAGTPGWVWLLVGCLVAPVVLGILASLVIVLIPKGKFEAEKTEDMNTLRQLGGAIVAERTTPLAPDGRIDVYKVLEFANDDQLVELCFSVRAGRGPTLQEIGAGDYNNFPWQRYKGRPPLGSAHEFPILWEKTPTQNERLIALHNGGAKVWPESRFQDFLSDNPAQR